MRFKNYLDGNEDVQGMLEAVIFMEEFDCMNEGIGEFGAKIKSILPKLGLHAKKSGPGLIQILSKSTTTMAKFFWYAMKASIGDAEAKSKVKEMANKEISKEQLMDFLLKVDTMSMHLFTGPIHMIEALTGWHIGAHIKQGMDSLHKKVEQAIKHLEDVAKTAGNTIKKKIVKYIEGIKKLFSNGETA